MLDSFRSDIFQCIQRDHVIIPSHIQSNLMKGTMPAKKQILKDWKTTRMDSHHTFGKTLFKQLELSVY